MHACVRLPACAYMSMRVCIYLLQNGALVTSVSVLLEDSLSVEIQ